VKIDGNSRPIFIVSKGTASPPPARARFSDAFLARTLPSKGRHRKGGATLCPSRATCKRKLVKVTYVLSERLEPLVCEAWPELLGFKMVHAARLKA
jgi:hypothetical protein